MNTLYFKVFTSLFLLSVFFIPGSSSAQSNIYLHFDGQDDYVEFPNASSYLSGSNTISMAGWFYTEELIYGQGMMSIRGGGTGDGQMYLIQLNNGTVECRVMTSTGLHEFVAPAGTIEAGVWQHLVWVFNENELELFVDGVSIGTSAASGTFDSDDRPFTIGKTLQSGLNFVFKGRADEVSLWNKALSQAEVEDMIANELEGDEEGLITYYKFNQGVPGGNNQAIDELISEVGTGERNAFFQNMALNGETSNFGGELEDGFQVINFDLIGNKLINDDPFELSATATSGLPISFEIVSGPATIDGNTVTLTGEPGEVTIQASQDGNDIYDPATDVVVSFEVLDPEEVLAEVELLHPLAGDVHVPELMPLKVAVRTSIGYEDLFSVESVEVMIDGQSVELEDWENGFFTGWWTPEEYGEFDISILANNNFGNGQQEMQTINIVSETSDVTTLATDEVWVNADISSVTVESDLPSHIGAYDQIIGTLYIDCPDGGCDPWDRVSSVEVQGKNGEWFEIIRYMTPYGVACSHQIDLTDFASLLSGKTRFRVNLGTFDNGFLYTLELDYQAGVPEYPYSQVKKLWYQTYQFGDMANLQPTEDITFYFPENTSAAKMKLVSSGHGWGENNTSNAAEFNENTHHIWVDGEETFEQNNWNDCDPNPDNCSPQAGTWYFNRAGWCPGTIAQFFDYDMTSFVGQGEIDLEYIFDEDYVDFCHPNNPDCVSGSTCPNCDDGFNPHLIVSSYLISLGQAPISTNIDENSESINQGLNLYPNPSTGQFYIEVEESVSNGSIEIYNQLGALVKQVDSVSLPKQGQHKLDIGGMAPGVYVVQVRSASRTLTQRLILE
ncbi:LamG-like jellyroll fold domain-containing protein [Halocola ammonii]